MWAEPSTSMGSFAGGKPSASFGTNTSILNPDDATGTGAPCRAEFMMRLEF